MINVQCQEMARVIPFILIDYTWRRIVIKLIYLVRNMESAGDQMRIKLSTVISSLIEEEKLLG
jgi:hypothetical protein